jgi:hypothetical protein
MLHYDGIDVIPLRHQQDLKIPFSNMNSQNAVVEVMNSYHILGQFIMVDIVRYSESWQHCRCDITEFVVIMLHYDRIDVIPLRHQQNLKIPFSNMNSLSRL